MFWEIVARQALALVFLTAGLAKVFDGQTATLTIKGYELVPDRLAPVLGWSLPKLETALSLALIFNIFVFSDLVIAAILFGTFALGQLSVLVRGKRIPCGCFGNTEDFVTARTLLKTFGFLGLTLIGLRFDRTLVPSRFPLVGSVVVQAGVTSLYGLALGFLQVRTNDAILRRGRLATTVKETPRLFRSPHLMN